MLVCSVPMESRKRGAPDAFDMFDVHSGLVQGVDRFYSALVTCDSK